MSPFPEGVKVLSSLPPMLPIFILKGMNFGNRKSRVLYALNEMSETFIRYEREPVIFTFLNSLLF